MNNNELKIMVSGGRVVKAEVISDGSCVLTVEPATADDTTLHLREGIFKKVPASQLSLKDNFLNHIPQTKKEKKFMEEVKLVIKAGVRDFWRPVCDPSFDKNRCICYRPGMEPAVLNSCKFWDEKAKEFCPERGSRLGTRTEYIAFLAVIIKDIVAFGMPIDWAWNAVCNDSKELGHYSNSCDAKHALEETGSREFSGWCDLGNTFKILAKDRGLCRFWIAGGGFDDDGSTTSLATLETENILGYDRYVYHYGCGWLVLTEGDTDQ